jgi:hypothetical protein
MASEISSTKYLSVTSDILKLRIVSFLQTPNFKSLRLGLISSLISLMIVLSLFLSISTCYSFSTVLSTKEEGHAHVNRVICTNTGLCLIFYYRTKAPSDAVFTNGPYMKVVHLIPSGDLVNPSPSIYLHMNADIINNMDVYEVQEEGDLFRLIGYDGEILYEIWWFKNNNSVFIREKDLEGAFGWYEREIHHQWPQVNEIRNLSLIGLETPDSPQDFYQFLQVDIEGIDKVPIPITLEQLDDSNERYHLFNGHDSFYTFEYRDDFQYNHLVIRRLFLNGTFHDYMTLDLVHTNRRWFYYFIGKDHNCYFGIQGFDSNWEDYSLDQYTHTFYLVNLTSKQIFTQPFVTEDNSYAWDVLIDSKSHIHVIINTYTDTQYLKFTQSGILTVNSTLTFPETGRFHIPSNSFALYQDRYLLGGLEKENRNTGLFVIDTNSGKSVAVNGSLIPFIDYPKDYLGDFGFFILFPGLIAIVIFRKTRRSL